MAARPIPPGRGDSAPGEGAWLGRPPPGPAPPRVAVGGQCPAQARRPHQRPAREGASAPSGLGAWRATDPSPPTDSGLQAPRPPRTLHLSSVRGSCFGWWGGSRSGWARRRVPAAPSVCRGEAAAYLPHRRLHRGNHGDGAHPVRAASLKRHASRGGIPLP